MEKYIAEKKYFALMIQTKVGGGKKFLKSHNGLFYQLTGTANPARGYGTFVK